MKRLILGDIHGHFNSIKEIYDKEKPNEVIILGDYFDNYDSSDDTIVECFNNILKLREEHLQKNDGDFILLLGNHDYHYLNDNERYSGYRHTYSNIAKEMLQKAIGNNIIKLCHIDYVNKIIYSHAGISSVWMKQNEISKLEDINQVDLNVLRFVGWNVYGDDPSNSLIWIRPKSLLKNLYQDNDGYQWTQVVGHTNVREASLIDDKVYLIDALPHYYLVQTYDNKSKVITNTEILKNI